MMIYKAAAGVAVILLLASSAMSDSCKGDAAAKYSREKNKKEHYNIVLIGATGDLARRYLWKALFMVFKQRYTNDSVHFRIYASARVDADDGRRKISQLLLGLVNCESNAGVDQKCKEMKRKFVESVQYHRLKTERDFMSLSDLLYENTQSMYGLEPGSPVTYEAGRLVYLSIPPSAYSVTAKHVSSYLRPKVGHPWMRIVLEKPFGNDLDSAKSLAKDILKYFNETEVYRIDHYLGKTTVKQMLPFRYINRNMLEPRWNRDYIERVDIILKERETLAGRTAFYNDVGVISDVMQNHMTEMLARVAMELPEDSGNIKSLLHNKLRLLRDVRPPARDSVLTGQYATYNPELFADRGNKSDAFNMSVTPTFAAVLLYVDNWRWRDVPFVLVSGKKLDEKASYIRVRFRDSQFCLSATQQTDHSSCHINNQVIFRLGHGSSRSMITVSRMLGQLEAPRPGWSVLVNSTGKDESLFGQNAADVVQFVADSESEPYFELIDAIFDGARHLFVTTDSLLAAWNIWTPVIHDAASVTPRQYLGRGKDSSRLDFLITRDGRLQYWVNERNVAHHQLDQFAPAAFQMPKLGHIPATFRNATLVAGSADELAAKLTELIVDSAHEKVANGSSFHLAVSGGRTPEKLFHMLSRSSMPWRQTHVWMVDERCDGSNFEFIERSLLRGATMLPVRNIHPMLADYDDKPCSDVSHYRRDDMYENAIRRLVANASFDFLVLGVGADGHTASLFPGEVAVNERQRLVTFSTTRSQEHRLTLTLTAINSAHHVAILVAGAEKNPILRTISELKNSAVSEFPVVGVEPVTGRLTWFVDYNALFGEDPV